MKNKNIVNSW